MRSWINKTRIHNTIYIEFYIYLYRVIIHTNLYLSDYTLLNH